jgi:predicted RNase H-like HicB family nuclease
VEGIGMSNAVVAHTTNFRAIIHPVPEGGYWAEVPELTGCCTQGDTLDAIYNNLREAAACHLNVNVIEVRISPLEMAA